MVCVECRRVLDIVFTDDGPRYDHSVADLADHEPVPVEAPDGYRGGRCDFCNSDNPSHVLPARSFLTEMPMHGSDDDWAACTDCAVLIERDQWNRLLDRVWTCRAERGQPHGDAERAATKRLWRTLRKNVTGSLRPIARLR